MSLQINCQLLFVATLKYSCIAVFVCVRVELCQLPKEFMLCQLGHPLCRERDRVFALSVRLPVRQ